MRFADVTQMKCLLSLLLLFAAPGFTLAGEAYQTRCEWKRDPSKQTEIVRQVRASMDSIVFPEVSLSGVPFQDAISQVQQHIREHTPPSILEDQGSIGITLVARQDVKEPVDVLLRAATLPQILDAICARYNYVWCVDSFALLITTREGQSRALHVITGRRMRGVR